MLRVAPTRPCPRRAARACGSAAAPKSLHAHPRAPLRGRKRCSRGRGPRSCFSGHPFRGRSFSQGKTSHAARRTSSPAFPRPSKSPTTPSNLSRAPRALTLLVAALLALALTGCATGASFFTGASEYGLYRRARAAPTLEERLTASQEYLARHPDGLYTDEIRAFFARAEPLYFQGARTSIPALEAYLRALPRGPHAAEANLRLRDLRALDKAERTDLIGAADATLDSVTRETERRLAVGARLQHWIALFLDEAVFRAPMPEAKAALLVPWSLGLPWPFCERTDAGPDAPKGGPQGAARRCTKLLQLDYRAMEDGAPQERQALVEIAVWQDEPGRPLEVTVGGPDLFLRLHETVTARTASLNDPEARLLGAERAVEIALGALVQQVGDAAAPSCRKPPDTDVLRLACQGFELRLLASAADGEDDRFSIRPAR